MDKKKPCRHKYKWILGTSVEWCSACGAYRRLEIRPPNTLHAVTPWCRPEEGGADHAKFKRRTEAYIKRRNKNG